MSPARGRICSLTYLCPRAHIYAIKMLAGCSGPGHNGGGMEQGAPYTRGNGAAGARPCDRPATRWPGPRNYFRDNR